MSFFDLVLSVIFLTTMAILIGCAIWELIKTFSNTFKKPKLNLVESCLPYVNYDQELTDILKEAEEMRESLPLVTLWWGLQGLRLNRDGTTEWISRHPVDIPKDDPVKPSPSYGYAIGPGLLHSVPVPEYYPTLGHSVLCRYGDPRVYIHGLDCQNVTPEDRISFLESQQHSLQMAQDQSYQTRAILDSLMPARLYANDEVVYDSQEKHTL